jgi:hypothetical protein
MTDKPARNSLYFLQFNGGAYAHTKSHSNGGQI